MDGPERQTLRRRFVLAPVAWVACALLHGAPVLAQALDDAPLVLQRSLLLQEKIPPALRQQLPIFVSGDHASGETDLNTEVDGDAELRRGDTMIRADRLDYNQPQDLARAQGHVHLNRDGNVYDGPALQLKVDAFEGFFTSPSYRFLNTGYGHASRIDFIDDAHSVAHNATYTTCQRQPGPNWMPAWIFKATTLQFDTDDEMGKAQGAQLLFKNVPILPFPNMSFPLTDKRMSGLLPPTVGLDSVNGLEVIQPYYWDIAPNRDATLYPDLMSRRGLNLGGEFRYLEVPYRGQVTANYMPSDALRDRDRWSYASTDSGTINTGIAGIGNLGFNLNLNRVSDDNYVIDFPHALPSLIQQVLPNDASLSWARGHLSASARMLKWQTLQEPGSPITPPYDQLPHLTAAYTQLDANGFDYSLTGDYTHFSADPALELQPNGQRSFLLAQISHPWQAPGWFVIPKVQLNAASYEFDTPLANGASSASRVVPTFSLDNGLVFQRDTRFFGRSFVQTLEPRAFYVYTPYRNQSLLPNYDSALNDFNFATVFTENAFSGYDRISDSNLLTLGVTSRLLDPDTGAEAAKFGIAQRLRFKEQQVTLPGGTPDPAGFSDLLLGTTINWTPQWSLDASEQINLKTHDSISSSVGGHYSPGSYRVLNAAYTRYIDTITPSNSTVQWDVSWQWPINDLWGDKGQDLGPGLGQGAGRWYSVGRLNYSLLDHKLVNTVVGFEYDAGCWIGRVLLEQLTTSTFTTNKSIQFQLEFVGFSRLGSNPTQTLRLNIPGYDYLRQQTTLPSRFSNYD